MEAEVITTSSEDTTKPNEEVGGLKSKNAALITENTKFKNSFKAYGGVEAALQRLADIEAKAQEAEEAEAVKTGQLDAVKAKHTKELSDAQKANEALTQRLVRTHIDKLVADALATEKGSLKLLGPHLATVITGAMDKDGQIDVSVKGLDGQPLETVLDLVKALKTDDAFGAAFEASDVSGGGARGSGAKVIGNPFAKATEDVSAQMKLINEKPMEAKRLAQAAGYPKEQLSVMFP